MISFLTGNIDNPDGGNNLNHADAGSKSDGGVEDEDLLCKEQLKKFNKDLEDLKREIEKQQKLK
tara:strand:- start:259 stop:450 length:192 start_codon:yes stop_codon:yes gene_type:complete